MTGTSQRETSRARAGRTVSRRGALMIVAFVAVVVVVGIAVLGARQGTSVPAQLRWAPPIMKSPTTIGLKSGSDPEHLLLSPHRDYILKLPPNGLHGTVEIDGGHNVTLIGGTVTVPSTANQTDNGADGTDTAIYVRHSTGIVHIEGVLIKADHNVQYDGIDINAPQATVQVENVRVQAVYGSATTMHADVIQPWGGVHLLQVDHLTADGDYQGITIDPPVGTVETANIRNVDLTIDPPPAALAAHTDGGGIMLWLTGTYNCRAPRRTRLENVYINNQGRLVPTARTVWPVSNDSLGCAGALGRDGMTWPRLPVTGGVTFGKPPHGSFVPVGVAGNHYRSPGYIGHPNTAKP